MHAPLLSGRKINIFACLWFQVWWKIDLLEPRLKNPVTENSYNLSQPPSCYEWQPVYLWGLCIRAALAPEMSQLASLKADFRVLTKNLLGSNSFINWRRRRLNTSSRAHVSGPPLSQVCRVWWIIGEKMKSNTFFLNQTRALLAPPTWCIPRS